MAMTEQEELELLELEKEQAMSQQPPAEPPKTFMDGVKDTSKSIINGLPEAAGMIVGGIVGAPLGPVGAVAGAGLGAAGAHELKQGIKTLTGNMAPRSAKQAALEALSAGAEGAGAEMGGTIIGKMLDVAAPIAKGAGDIVGAGTKKAMSSIFGPSVDAIDARLANPSAIKNALSAPKIADKLANTSGELSAKIKALDSKAWGKLSRSSNIEDNAMTADDVSSLVNNAKNSLGDLIGGADKKAFKTLSEINDDIKRIYTKTISGYAQPAAGMEDITNIARQAKTPQEFEKYMNEPIYSESQIPNKPDLRMSAADFWKQAQNKTPTTVSENISESDIKGIIQKLDNNINWDDTKAETTNKVLEGLRTKIDGALKSKNEDYGNIMGEVSDNVVLSKELNKAFNIKKRIGETPSASDTTPLKVNTALKENKIGTQDILDRIKKSLGTDYTEDITNSNFAKEFEKPTTNGSRNAVTGAAVGAALGHVVPIPGAGWAGGAVGAIVGRQIDKQGGKYVADMIDTYTSKRIPFTTNTMADLVRKSPQMFGKYGPVLSKALQKSPQAFAVAHFLLGNQDPNYQKMIGDIDEQKEQSQ